MGIRHPAVGLAAVVSAGTLFVQPAVAAPAQATPGSTVETTAVSAPVAPLQAQSAEPRRYRWPNGYFNLYLRYKFYNFKGKCLAAKKTPYIKYKCSGKRGKKSHYLWFAERYTSGNNVVWARLKNKKTGKCLASSKSGKAKMKKCAGKKSQYWRWISYGEGHSKKKHLLMNWYYGYLWKNTRHTANVADYPHTQYIKCFQWKGKHRRY